MENFRDVRVMHKGLKMLSNCMKRYTKAVDNNISVNTRKLESADNTNVSRFS